jgi:hypothetical protein
MVASVNSGVSINVIPSYSMKEVKKALEVYYSTVVLSKILQSEEQTEELLKLRIDFISLFQLASVDSIIVQWRKFASDHNLPSFQIEDYLIK